MLKTTRRPLKVLFKCSYYESNRQFLVAFKLIMSIYLFIFYFKFYIGHNYSDTWLKENVLSWNTGNMSEPIPTVEILLLSIYLYIMLACIVAYLPVYLSIFIYIYLSIKIII